MKKNMKENNLELSFERLEAIVNKMESGDASLEQSMLWFEEGMLLIKECQAELKTAEQRVEHLIEESKKQLGSEDIK